MRTRQVREAVERETSGVRPTIKCDLGQL
jgi:hypothetical protein